jgi:hypothetical protein
VTLARRVAALRKRVRAAESLTRPASLSPSVAEVVGPDAADRWWKLRKENRAAASQLIAEVADIRLYAGKRGGDRRYRQDIDPGRVRWQWLTGPGEGQDAAFGEPSPRIHDQVADALRTDPYEADRALARKMQCNPLTVYRLRRELEDAGEIPVIRRRGKSAPVNHGYQPRSVT